VPATFGALVLAAGLLVLAGPWTAGAGAVTGGDYPPTSSVQVTFTPSTQGEGCVPFPVGVQHAPQNSSSDFRLRVVVTQPLCQPVRATAAIYAMTAYPSAWPQTLTATASFTLGPAGTTVVDFTKGCQAAQFDVVTGATPQVISPTGPWHGPLLFPFDTGTALQWGGCTTTTTTPFTIPTTTVPTTTTSSTTTSSSTTSTTVPVTTTTVPGPTTTVPGPTTTVPADVAGETTVAPPPPAQVAGIASTNGSLAFTGLGPTGYLLGGGLVAIGLVLMMFGRRPISQR
jgi:hypothetical protein